MELQHWFVMDLARPFLVFNDDGTLTMEPVSIEDLEPIRLVHGTFPASCAWSSDTNWYFIIMESGIALLSVVSGNGYFCKKRSAMFFDFFLSRPRQSTPLQRGEP